MAEPQPSGEKHAGLLADLWAVHDAMEDRGMCPYYRRGEEGQDPKGICSFGCRDEPSCQTDHGGPEFPWPSEMLRDLIARVEQVGWWNPNGHPGYQLALFNQTADDVPVYTLATGSSPKEDDRG